MFHIDKYPPPKKHSNLVTVLFLSICACLIRKIASLREMAHLARCDFVHWGLTIPTHLQKTALCLIIIPDPHDLTTDKRLKLDGLMDDTPQTQLGKFVICSNFHCYFLLLRSCYAAHTGGCKKYAAAAAAGGRPTEIKTNVSIQIKSITHLMLHFTCLSNPSVVEVTCMVFIL